jgi:XkdW protein
MKNLSLAIMTKYPNALPSKDYIVRNDGEGDYIAFWDYAEEPKPTVAEMEAWWFDYRMKEKRREMSEACNQAILGNFFSPSVGYEFEFAEYDQSNMTQQMLLLIADPTITTVNWKIADQSIVTLTREQFFAMVNDANLHKRNNLSKFWQKEAELKTYTTFEQIDEMTWDDEESGVIAPETPVEEIPVEETPVEDVPTETIGEEGTTTP